MEKAGGKLEITPSSGPPLYFNRGSFEAIKGHQDANYSFLATACNHTLDFGAAGVDSTLSILKSNGIESNGANASEEVADQATVVEINGIRVGILSYTFGLNGKQAPLNRPRIVNRLNLNGDCNDLDLTQLEKQLTHCETAGLIL